MRVTPPSEADFSGKFREALRKQGVRFVQLIDCGVPGPSDYLMLSQIGQSPRGAITVYVELKVADRALEPEQQRFLRDCIKGGHRAYVLRHVGNCMAWSWGAEDRLLQWFSADVGAVDWAYQLFQREV